MRCSLIIVQIEIRSCRTIPNSFPFLSVWWSLRVWRLKHSGHLVVKPDTDWQFGERQKIRTQFLSWLRSSVVRASDRQSEDPSSIPGGAALCFFRLIQLSVHICRIEKERSLISCEALYRLTPTSRLPACSLESKQQVPFEILSHDHLQSWANK